MKIWYAVSRLFTGGMGMDDQQNLLNYETIKGVVAGEKWVIIADSSR